MEAAAEKSRSATVLDLQAWTYYNLYQTTNWGNLLSDLHVPHEQFVYGYPSFSPRAHCTPNKSVPTLRYTLSCFHVALRPRRRDGLLGTGKLHSQAWTYIYRSMPEGSYRVQSPGFMKIVYYRVITISFLAQWNDDRRSILLERCPG